MRLLHARRALVVGGSGGLGAALSLELARLGAYVIVHGGSSKASDLAQRIVERGDRAEAWEYRFGSIKDFIALCESYFPIDILVVSFGPFLFRSLAKVSLHEWERIVAWNLTLPGALVSHCVPIMATRKWGRIILFGGNTPQPDGYRRVAAYEAAKAGISVLVKSIAREFGGEGVSAHGFYPDFVDTEYVDAETKKRWQGLSKYENLLEGPHIATVLEWIFTAPSQVVNGVLFPLRVWDAAKQAGR